METVIGGYDLDASRGGLRGDAYAPGNEGYDEARRAWNLNAAQHPELVIVAEGAADVQAAVRLAGRAQGPLRPGERLPLQPQHTAVIGDGIE